MESVVVPLVVVVLITTGFGVNVPLAVLTLNVTFPAKLFVPVTVKVMPEAVLPDLTEADVVDGVSVKSGPTTVMAEVAFEPAYVVSPE